MSLLIYVLLFCGYGFVLWYALKNAQERGLFGDAFGGFNAFISGLAFLGIVATLVLQQRQLSIQLDELRCQREELALQRQELANQVGEMKATREQVEVATPCDGSRS